MVSAGMLSDRDGEDGIVKGQFYGIEQGNSLAVSLGCYENIRTVLKKILPFLRKHL